MAETTKQPTEPVSVTPSSQASLPYLTSTDTFYIEIMAKPSAVFNSFPLKEKGYKHLLSLVRLYYVTNYSFLQDSNGGGGGREEGSENSNWVKLLILILHFNQIGNIQSNTLALSYPGADLQNNSCHRIARFSF